MSFDQQRRYADQDACFDDLVCDARGMIEPPERKPRGFRDQMQELVAGGMSAREAAREMGIDENG